MFHASILQTIDFDMSKAVFLCIFTLHKQMVNEVLTFLCFWTVKFTVVLKITGTEKSYLPSLSGNFPCLGAHSLKISAVNLCQKN